MQFKLPAQSLLLLTSLWLTLTANQSFFSQVVQTYPFSQHIGFVSTLALLLFCSITLFAMLLNCLLPMRWVLSILLLIGALSGFYTDTFGIVIDGDMIRNLLETNVDEASDLISFDIVWHLLLFALLPIAALWLLPVQNVQGWSGWKRRTLHGFALSAVLLSLSGLCLFSYSGEYASFFRQHKAIRYYANPLHPVYAAIKYSRQQWQNAHPKSLVSIAAFAEVHESNHHHELIVVVVGETARADHFSLNGYTRQTNPRLSQEPRLISFTDITACGTSTAISVPCLFSLKGHDDFDVNEAQYTENVLDVLAKAQVHIEWLDNNSDSKHVADRIQYLNYKSPDINHDCDIECRDTGMLTDLQAFIDQQDRDTLIVLHQMGSHGPAYYKRYPSAFEVFSPTCTSAELSECSDGQIINSYDNSIVYTDYFLSQVIQLLKRNTPQFETAMLYVGDHGESLGENHLYLHGMPYLLAPDAQKKVPLLLWVGASSDIDFEQTRALKDIPNSHDAFASALLSAFEIETDAPRLNTPPLLVMQPD